MSDQAASTVCAAKPAITRRPTAVRVNGVVIPRADIARETQNHPADKPIAAWLAAARALVVRELLLQEARRVCISASPLADPEGRRETDEEAMIRSLVEQEVTTPTADLETCRRYFDANRRRFRSPDLFEVSHILIAASPKDAVARTRAREKAQRIATTLQGSGPGASFAVMAEAESACPSGKLGGSLGQIGPGQTVPEFEAALRDLPVGAVADRPVETRYGFHVVRVDRRIDGSELPFEAVHAKIAHWLDDKVRRTAIRQYISVLAGQAKIEGVSLDASSSPLVQ